MRFGVACARVALALLAVAANAQSPQVTLAGSLGQTKALLLIDGHPQTLAVGASARGVTLRSVSEGQAEVLVAGQLLLLRPGVAPSRVGGNGVVAGTGTKLVIAAGPGGHFSAAGAIASRLGGEIPRSVTGLRVPRDDADGVSPCPAGQR